MIKNSIVYYHLPHVLGRRVKAIVDTVHRDGTVTVTARHVVDEDGEPEGGFLGYQYRIDAGELATR